MQQNNITGRVLKEQCHISRIFSFPFFLPFYKLLMDLFQLKHIIALLLPYSIFRYNRSRRNHCHYNVYIRLRSLHFPMLQIYCLPNKFFCADCEMISFDFHHLGAFFRPELFRFPPCSPSFESAIDLLDSKLDNAGPTLSSLLRAEAYA